MESHSVSEDFHELSYLYGEHITLDRIVELSGALVAEGCTFDCEDFIQVKPFQDARPDREYWGGYDNKCNTRHQYRRTVYCHSFQRAIAYMLIIKHREFSSFRSLIG